MSRNYSPGRQNGKKSYAIAVDRVLTAYWSCCLANDVVSIPGFLRFADHLVLT